MNNRKRQKLYALGMLLCSHPLHSLNHRRVRYIPKRIYKNDADEVFLVFDLLVY